MKREAIASELVRLARELVVANKKDVVDLKLYGWNLRDMNTFGEKLWNHLSYRLGLPKPHGKIWAQAIKR